MRKQEREVAGRIAGEVRRLRAARGWSQLELAERADLSLNYVSLIERAERLPSVEVLIQLAAALGATFPALVTEPAGVEPDPWLAEASGVLRSLPVEVRPMVLGMLRGVSGALPVKPASGVRAKRKRRG